MKKLINLVIILLFILFISGCEKNDYKSKYSIISTSFPGYDFARAVTKDSEFNVEMLLKPGSEIHDFEPTPQDIIKIKNSDIFIYVGGESDEWIKDILKDINGKTKIIKLMDLVETYEEEHVEGMEDEDHDDEEIEYDEHVWTSPTNAITMIEKIKEEIVKIDSDNKDLYEKNLNNYVLELSKIDAEIKNIVENSKRKEIIFGDRFPLRYFTEAYGLTYYAAFPGCSEATEASAKTISFLIKKVKSDKIPVVFKIELSNGKIANTIAKEANAKVLEFHSAHNITKDDFTSGLTYIDIMRNNIKSLSEALN